CRGQCRLPAGGLVVAVLERRHDLVQLGPLGCGQFRRDVAYLERVVLDVVVLGLALPIVVFDIDGFYRPAETRQVLGRDAHRFVGRRVAAASLEVGVRGVSVAAVVFDERDGAPRRWRTGGVKERYQAAPIDRGGGRATCELHERRV